jgi:hypothetical protein
VSGNAKAVLTALGVVAGAVIIVLTSFDLVDWSGAQTTLVSAEAAAMIALLTAIVSHLWPGTPKEPVALAATLTAAVSATLALGTGFAWWDWTPEQISAVVSLVTAVIGVGSATVARSRVSPTT